MTIIGTKWVFRNKLYENSIVSRNKFSLVAQGYNQQKGIDYDETYAPVARLESIRILLAYACALDFKLFQMDVKSAFLNGFINEEVYVAQPPGFIDFEKPDHVYKLKKALYGLKQAPKAWYDRLKSFLIKHEYKMGMFEMSMMGELNFFLRLQIKQMEDGIFFNQSKYIKEMLKKFGLEESKPMKTPMSSDTKLTKDEECESVDSTKYRGMIGSLLYLTASRPDIMFSVCLCAHFQEAPKTSHLEAVKHIFRYIKGTTHLGLWYPKGTGIETVVYADSDHAGDYVDRKSTSGICTFVGCCLTSWFSKKQTALAISTTEAEYCALWAEFCGCESVDRWVMSGMVDNTLFTKKKSSNLIIVQIYVDDIIFGSTCQDMCDEFAKIMHDEFEMSMMGELNFFLGLQIKQMEDGIFFNQSKYIKEMLKKFGLEESKPMKTPMSSDTKLTKDEECESVDSTKYRGMIGSLLYLTASRPDIMFSVCLCARFQEAPKTSHLEAVKHIFRYIKGTTHLGLWYPKGTGIETVVYADSDHAGDYVDRKSTSGICTFLVCCLKSWLSKKQTALAISTTEARYVSA
ncbi:retrovirus-related pol polyprotein from transposon TNT 1-94 [Tanacetum coccineum]